MSLIEFLKVNFPDRFSGARLYHYSRPGLLETFFADDADFYCTYYASLNDDHEIVEGWDAVSCYLHDAVGVPAERIELLMRGYRELFYKDISSPWIMSFSEEGDSLYQWAMYADRIQGGYAFGFNRGVLRNRVRKVLLKEKDEPHLFDMWLTPCFYEVDSLQKIFDFYFNRHREVVEHFATARTLSSGEVLNLASKVSIIADTAFEVICG